MKRFGKRHREELFGRRGNEKRTKNNNMSDIGRSETNVGSRAADREDEVDREYEVRTDLQVDAPYTSSGEDIRIGEKFPHGSRQDGTVSSDDSSDSCAESSDEVYGECDADNVVTKCETPGIESSESGKKVEFMSAEYLLGSLLTCGSHRLSTVMYKLVRKLLAPKACCVCGTSVNGARLPCMASLKSKGKPQLKTWYAKHDVLQLTVDEKRAGAKTGVDKFSSDKTAPVAVVKPSEWAKRDLYTPSI